MRATQRFVKTSDELLRCDPVDDNMMDAQLWLVFYFILFLFFLGGEGDDFEFGLGCMKTALGTGI